MPAMVPEQVQLVLRKIAGLPRLARTLAYVPPRQIADRLAYAARTYYYRTPLWGLSEVWRSHEIPAAEGAEPGLPLTGGMAVRPPLLVRGRAAAGKQIADGQWTFAGVTLPRRTLAGAEAGGARGGAKPMDWMPARASALWLFNLHYFEWLADLRAAGERALAQELLRDWLVQYSRWHRVAWHPYPVSLRIVSWRTHADWLLEGADAELRAVFDSSLKRQVAYLADNLETGLGANHLIKNLRALVTAGCCLPGAEAYLMQGLAGLLRQLPVQVHADGGHYEASPWYHVQVLEDLLAVQFLLKKRGGAPAALNDAIRRMGLALAFYRHPDGGLALFNDGAVGQPEALDHLQALAGATEVEPPVALPETGYVRLARGPMVLLCDVGKVGPDANPGHAHADSLSFELSVGEDRLIVNSGTYAYQDRARNTFRGTPAHSTVNVDGLNSAEVWAVFRVGRRPEDLGYELKDTVGGDGVLAAWHDGYRMLGIEHRRQWLLAADGSRLRGQDVLVGGGRRKHRMLAHFPVHPRVKVTLQDDRSARLALPGGRVAVFRLLDGGRLTVKDGWYAPQFGHKEPMPVLVAMVPQVAGAKGQAGLTWEIELS